jgi:DNA-binding transcriptional ArsR family regulator
MSSLPIDVPLLRKTALYYRAVNHKLRLQMLKLIHKNGRMTVKTIYKAMRLDQSAASQHLAVLRRAGIVCTERDGKWIFYSVDYHHLKLLHSSAEMLEGSKQVIKT